MSGSVIFIVTTTGIGKGVEYGASPKSGIVPEMIYKSNITAPDKMGMTIEGKLKAMDTTIVEGTLEMEPSISLVLVEKGLEYLSGEVTANSVEEKGSVPPKIEMPNVTLGYGTEAITNG